MSMTSLMTVLLQRILMEMVNLIQLLVHQHLTLNWLKTLMTITTTGQTMTNQCVELIHSMIPVSLSIQMVTEHVTL